MSSEVKAEETEGVVQETEIEVRDMEETLKQEEQQEEDEEEEDEEALPHSEVLDIFEEAPQVITDINKLPRHPSQIQCPHCEQYVITETSTMVGNTSWLMCLVCTFMGCIAGCCLFPFCISGFRDVQHKCPKCRSRIHTCTNM
ncbi:uncharacterized protein LOC113640468 isoform X1 [Tachysurus ichikawai]